MRLRFIGLDVGGRDEDVRGGRHSRSLGLICYLATTDTCCARKDISKPLYASFFLVLISLSSFPNCLVLSFSVRPSWRGKVNHINNHGSKGLEWNGNTHSRQKTGMQKEEEDKEKSLRLSARVFVLVG